MKMLIIEDDSHKMRRIAEEVKAFQKDADITEARSYRSGIANLMSLSFDFVLLDMSLPNFDISPEEDGFQTDPFAGRSILSEMFRKRVYTPTAVITMFDTFGDGNDLMTLDELDKELAQNFPQIYRGLVYYNSSEINWKEALRKIMEDK
jgi:hypothetical protein